MSLIDPAILVVADLPSVALKNVQDLPDATGIYCLINGEGMLLYIGQAVSIRKRLMNHPHRKTLLEVTACRCAWILVPYDALSTLEIAMIDFFKPPMNKMKGGNTRPVTEAATYEQTTLRVPPELLDILRGEARKIGRPLNTHMIRILEGHCARASKKRQAAASA